MTDQPPKPKRRWFQFSLHSLLILVALVAGLLAAWRVYVEPYRRQRETMALIKDLGGKYTTEPGDKWLRRLYGDDFQNLVLVDLADCDEPDEYLDQVAALPQLKTLSVGSQKFTDEHLFRLKRLTTLRELVLDSTDVSDQGIEELKQKLPELVIQQSQRRRELAQFVVVKRLRTLFSKPSRRREAFDKLMEINSPHAVKAIANFTDPKREKSTTVRRLFVRVLENINSSAATNLLAEAALYDPSKDVRLDAMEILGERKQKSVVCRFIERLGDEDHRIINRAGIALSYMDDKSAIGPLINALVTTHTFVKRTGGGTTPTMPGRRQRLVVRTVKIKRSFENNGVQIALLKLTDQNYGYDVAQWKAWHANRRRTQIMEVRRD